jgi:flagellar basal-body rod protein FlgB
MTDKLDATLRFHSEALNLRARRQEIIATNIAHADTPNYKSRDIDFKATLAQAVANGRQSSVPMATTSSRHIAGNTRSQGVNEADLMYRTPSQASIDGNTVEMDAERVNFADNAMRYEANLTILGAKIKTLLSAAQ